MNAPAPGALGRFFLRMIFPPLALAAAAIAGAPPAFPGRPAHWEGYDRYEFTVGGKTATVLAPHREAPGRPWVWYGEFLGHTPDIDRALLARGYHIVYLRVPDMFGCPDAVADWNRLYRELTEHYGFAKKAALIGISRGGLYVYNWAEANPGKVSCIYGDAPVCDFKSWPGGKGRGRGNPAEWQRLLGCYHFKSEAEALAYAKNPADNLAPLARAGVPLLHVYCVDDTVVPWAENTGVVAERYRALGGRITLIAKPGADHNAHGLPDPTPLVDFIARHEGAAAQAGW